MPPWQRSTHACVSVENEAALRTCLLASASEFARVAAMLPRNSMTHDKQIQTRALQRAYPAGALLRSLAWLAWQKSSLASYISSNCLCVGVGLSVLLLRVPEHGAQVVPTHE